MGTQHSARPRSCAPPKGLSIPGNQVFPRCGDEPTSALTGYPGAGKTPQLVSRLILLLLRHVWEGL